MNRKQLTLILVLVVVIGGLGLWMRHRNVASFQTASSGMGQKVLGNFDLNSVATIDIEQGTNTVDLVFKDNKWRVQQRKDYPANYTDIRNLVRKLGSLKAVDTLAVARSDLGRLKLLAPDAQTNAGTLVELKDKSGKVIHSILLGKKHRRQPSSSSASPMGGNQAWPDGRYIMADNQLSSVCLVSDTFTTVEPKPAQWLDKDFFKVEKPKTIAVTYPIATNSFELERKTASGSWELADARPGESLDSSKASTVGSALGYPSFNDVVVDPKPSVTGLNHPTRVAITTFDGFHYNIDVGKQSGSAYYLTVKTTADLPKKRTPGKNEKKAEKEKLDKAFQTKEAQLKKKLHQEEALEGWTYLVPKWSLDSLLKKRSGLLAKAKPAKNKTTPKVAAHTPPVATTSSSVPNPMTVFPSKAPVASSGLTPLPVPATNTAITNLPKIAKPSTNAPAPTSASKPRLAPPAPPTPPAPKSQKKS